mmetsp:Transcript_2790/g.4114  ORF Transcript_2790/g.4114 Transcript_2790/m.4114 type:complete len:1196 (+) Transcript_2790:84-3671(+)
MPSLTEDKEETHCVAEATEGKMLLLTVSPGKLGLTVRVDKVLGGCTITAIAPACKFKDRVEVGDRIVTIDGQKISKIADLQINNTKMRSFGVVKKTIKNAEHREPTKQQAPPPSSQAAVKTASTPVSSNTAGNPVVTTEKSTSTKKDANDNKDKADEKEDNFQVLINCPDGTVINLSSGQRNNNEHSSHVILGRGKHGIPSSSLVPPQACALRIVADGAAPPQPSNSRKQFALELVALGMERCTVLRDGNALFVTSVAQMLTSGMGCPSSILLRDGDVIQPFDREAAAAKYSLHHEFKVVIVSRGDSPPATGESKDAAVVGGSAFAVASKKIDEAATMGVGNGQNSTTKLAANPSGVKDSEEAVVDINPFDFDKESLRQTFVQKPNSTASFFLTYYKILSKKKSTNANTELGDNLLNTFIDAMSPQDHANRDANVVLSGSLENFPLKQILDILVQGKDTDLGKRAIEGYIWLSCRRKYEKKNSGHSVFDGPNGPILLASPKFPLTSMCDKIGWDNLEALLVEAMEMLCKYQISSVRPFALLEKVEPTASSGSESAQSRIFFRLAKVAYEKRFTADPVATALDFVEYNRCVYRRSCRASVKLINAFVDAMSPSDSSSRRVPLKEISLRFPLEEILATILVDGKHKELGKRVLEGYVWLSSQKYSIGSSKPRGPELLAGTLDGVCNKIGWNLLGDVLVESVEKLCEFDNTHYALQLMERIARLSSCGEASQCTLVRVRLAKLTSKKMLNIDRFRSTPVSTAKLFLTQYKQLEKDSSNKQFCSELLNSFVDIMSPLDIKNRKVPNSQITQAFPLKDILGLLVDGGHMQLGKRVLEGYVWLSSQQVPCYVSGGPTLLDTADASLVSMCEALGWNELETVLVESVEMLCKYRNTEKAVLLVDKISAASEGHRLRICSKMAKIACDKMIEELRGTRQYRSAQRLPLYKKLLWLVGNYCPTIAPKFVTLAKNLDVDAILYPLLTDVALRSSSSVEAMKNTLSELTTHCAQILSSRVSSDSSIVSAWTITNAHLYQFTEFGDFLQNQCKQTFDWRVRKSDHRGFEADLRRLINAQEIRCMSYQPGYSGAYHFKITKLKTCRVALSALSCSCSDRTYLYDSKIRLEPTDCLRHSSQTKHQNDKAKLDAIKAYLPADSSLKRKAVDALGGDDDDDVVLTGVAGIAETVAKRVKAAEDAGEVIEIL